MTKGLRLNKKVNENQIENQIMTEEDLVDDILQNYEILSDDYSKYLKKSIDIETFDLLPLYLEAEKLKKLIRFCHVLQKSSMDITGDSLIKLSVIMYSNILDADDMNGNSSFFQCSYSFFSFCSSCLPSQ